MSNPALWARVRDARGYLEEMPDLMAALADEAHRQVVSGEPDVPITGPGPSSTAPARGLKEDRRAYRLVCRSLGRADCLLGLAAKHSPRIRHRRLPYSGPAAKRQRTLSLGEAGRLCTHMGAALEVAYDVRLERPEATRLLRESVKAVEDAYRVCLPYRNPKPRKLQRRRA